MNLLLWIQFISFNTFFQIVADGSEPFVLLGCLLIIYFIIDGYIRERKRITKNIEKIIDEAESIELKYGHISKSYYWMIPDKSFKRILILKRPKKVIIMDDVYDYFIIKGLRVKQEQIPSKGILRKKQFINEYTLDFLIGYGFQQVFRHSIKMSSKDKIYSNPSFIRSNKKIFISAEKVVNELDSIISEVERRNRKH